MQFVFRLLRPRRSLLSSKVWMAGLLSLPLSSVLPLSAQAQTGPTDPIAAVTIPDLRNANEARVRAAWEQLQAELQTTEATMPAAVIPLYGQFLDQGGARYAAVAIDVTSHVGKLYLVDLRDFDKAIEAYDWGLANYRQHPDAFRLQSERLEALKAQKQQEQTKRKAVTGDVALPTANAAVPNVTVPQVVLPQVTGPIERAIEGAAPVQIPGLQALGIKPVTATPFERASVTAVPFSMPPVTFVPPSLTPAIRMGNYLGWKAGVDRCITALARQKSGRLWVATEDNGVWSCDESAPALTRWKQFRAADGLGDDSAYAIAIDGQDRVWVGTLNHGVSVWNGKTWRNYGVLEGPLGERVFDIAVCPTDGDVWIATNAGLTRYSTTKDRWSYLTKADGLPSDQVQTLAFDQAGNLIAGTQCDGVALASAAKSYQDWRVVRGPEAMPTTPRGAGLPGSLINDVLVARDGTYYVATTLGLAWSTDGGVSWSYVRGQDYGAKVQGRHGGPPAGWSAVKAAVLAEDYVSCLAEDGAGHLWLGHWSQGHEVLENPRAVLTGGGSSLTNITYSPGVQSLNTSGQEATGFVRAMLPSSQVSSQLSSSAQTLIARYDQGLSQAAFSNVTASSSAKPVAVSTANRSTTPSTLPSTTTATPFPAVAAVPTAAELGLLLQRIQLASGAMAPGDGYYEGEDWRTQGDWLGRYGSAYTVLCAAGAPLNHYVINDLSYNVQGSIGPNFADDSLRHWIHWLKTDNPRVLYNPLLGHRREAEWDDHGEAMSLSVQGPDVWTKVSVPTGTHRLSVYTFNKDGHDGMNRLRDYWLELKKGEAKTVEEAQQLPTQAQARVRDFWGGVYKVFTVQGPGDYYLAIRKNYSYNAIVQAVFLDQVAGPQTPWASRRDVWLGDTRFETPSKEEAKAIEEQALQALNGAERDSLQSALDLWHALDSAYAKPELAGSQYPGRLQAYRVVNALYIAHGGNTGVKPATTTPATTTPASAASLAALLRYWRWSLPLWPAEDRGEFEGAMAKGWKSFRDINPEWEKFEH